MHIIEDVNVNTTSQSKGMCEAGKNPGDKVQSTEGGLKKWRKMEQTVTKRVKRILGAMGRRMKFDMS